MHALLRTSNTKVKWRNWTKGRGGSAMFMTYPTTNKCHKVKLKELQEEREKFRMVDMPFCKQASQNKKAEHDEGRKMLRKAGIPYKCKY